MRHHNLNPLDTLHVLSEFMKLCIRACYVSPNLTAQLGIILFSLTALPSFAFEPWHHQLIPSNFLRSDV